MAQERVLPTSSESIEEAPAEWHCTGVVWRVSPPHRDDGYRLWTVTEKLLILTAPWIMMGALTGAVE